MAVINFGKVKLVHRGEYSGITTYNHGDIVSFGTTAPPEIGAFQHTNPVFVYKNQGSKVGSHPYLQTVSGTVATLGISTNIITLTIASGNNLGGTHESYAVPKLAQVYSKYLPGNTTIIEKTVISATQVQLKLSKYTNNTTTITNDPVIVGARRYGNRYDIQLNSTDWEIYSDTFIFRGDWDKNQTYFPGNIVVRNEESYICKSPTGIGSTYLGLNSQNLGPCTTVSAIDPQWDYLDVWDTYVNNDPAQEPENKTLLLPNTDPIYWAGHPFIPQPRWNQTGIGSVYQGGWPWKIQAGLGTHPHRWRWTGHPHLYAEAVRISFIAGDGRQVTTGSTTETLTSAGNAGGNDAQAGSKYLAEGDSFMMNGYLTSENNATGNLPFEKTRSKVYPIQYLYNSTHRAYLFANGTVGVAGHSAANAAGGIKGLGYDGGAVSNIVCELGHRNFGNRKIVKIDMHVDHLGDGVTNSTMAALDEYGELWVWGSNGYYQLGIGSDFGDSGGLNSEYLAATGNVNTPICLEKDDRFEGRRLVDFVTGSRAAWALDEDGELWSWGHSLSGQLGYPTNDTTKFRTAAYARSPHRLSDQGILGFDWTGAALDGLVGAGYTNITQITSGVSYTKTSGGAAWNAQVYSTTGYASTVAISAKAGQINGAMVFGLSSNPTADATWGNLLAGWYFVLNDDYVQYIQNANNVNQTAGGASGRYQYTTETVLSIVYEPISNCVHWYYDYHGDGRCVQLVRRLQKNSTNFTGITSTSDFYFDSSFYSASANLNSISISSSITPRTWATYGGIQKFLTNKGRFSGNTSFYVLDGQGYFWSCGYNNDGQLGDSRTAVSDDSTSSLQRRHFNFSGITTDIVNGRINNFWVCNNLTHNVFFSVQDINNSNVNYLYGLGDNANYQLTTGNTTDSYNPVIISGPTSPGTTGGASVGIGSTLRNIIQVYGGGSGPTGTANKQLLWALDSAGYLYASGHDKYGASGAVNIAASDDVTISNNATKMQQYDSDRYGWARVYQPGAGQGKIIDIRAPGFYSASLLDWAAMYSMTEDAQGFYCGANAQHYVQVSGIGGPRAPITLPGMY